MRLLLCAVLIVFSIGQAAAQGKVSAGEAHVLSALATGADPLVFAENVKAGPVLRAQLGVDTDSRGIYEWLAAHTAGTRPRVTLLAPAEAASHASLGLTPGEQLMRVEAGAAAFLVQYSAARKNITFVEQLSAPSANAPLLKPAAPLAALPPPVPAVPAASTRAPVATPAPRTGPRGECVVKPVMSEDDIWNCSAPAPAAVAAPPALAVAAPERAAPPAPTVALAAPAPALKATGECVIKPVMSEQDLRNCASSTQTSTPMLETRAAPVAAVAVVPQAAVKTPAECIIKPVMSDEDLRNCANARGSMAPAPTAVGTSVPAAVVATRASPASRDCVIKPVMSDEDLRNCASARGSTAPSPPSLETSAAPQVRAAPVPSAPKECVIKPVMSDDDLRACGIRR